MFFLTEFFAGESLHDVIHDDDLRIEYNVDESKIMNICFQICDAVLFLHTEKAYYSSRFETIKYISRY